MNRNDYIKAVLSQIEDKTARAEVARELNDHLDDRIEFYIDGGYSPAEAEEKAVARMGDGESAGYRLNRMHNSKGDIVIHLLLVITLSLLLFITAVFNIPCDSTVCTLMLTAEYLSVLSVGLYLTYAIKRNKLLPTVISFVFYAGTLFFRFYGAFADRFENYFSGRSVSAVVTSLVYIFTGNLTSLNIVSNDLAYIKPATWINVLSYGFYCCVFLCIAAAYVHIKRFQRLRYTQQQSKRKKLYANALTVSVIFLFLTATVSLVTCWHPFHFGVFNDYETYDELVIYEADSQDIDEATATEFQPEYDWSVYTPLENSTSVYTEQRLDQFFVYKVCESRLTYVTDKRYVYITDRYIMPNEATPENWLCTDNAPHEITVPLEQNGHPINVIKITVEQE